MELTLACPACSCARTIETTEYQETLCPDCGCGRVLAGGYRERGVFVYWRVECRCPHCRGQFRPGDARDLSTNPLDCPACNRRLWTPVQTWLACEPED